MRVSTVCCSLVMVEDHAHCSPQLGTYSWLSVPTSVLGKMGILISCNQSMLL